MKRVIIVHGWGGSPQGGWFPWLKEELERKGFEVISPQLPGADKPRIEKWVPAVAQAIGIPNVETYFVGHSMGCQAVARYLETLPINTKVGGAVFVAGFFKRLTNLESDPDWANIEKYWLGAPINFEKVRESLLISIALFSDNDPYVPLDNQEDFKDKLGSQIIIEHGMGHFSGDDGITKLPIVLSSVLELNK